MMRTEVAATLLLSALLLTSLAVPARCAKLAIILLDGFRWDYAERMSPRELPNLRRFMSEGVRAEYVQPVFPASSFPSWTTIVSGTTMATFLSNVSSFQDAIWQTKLMHFLLLLLLVSEQACTRTSMGSSPTRCTTAPATSASTCTTSARTATRPRTRPGGAGTCPCGSRPPGKVSLAQLLM